MAISEVKMLADRLHVALSAKPAPQEFVIKRDVVEKLKEALDVMIQLEDARIEI